MIHRLNSNNFFLILLGIFFIISCSQTVRLEGSQETKFNDRSIEGKISHSNYDLNFKYPEKFTDKNQTEFRITFTFDECEFIVMIIPYGKDIPRWAYYNERITYQNLRVSQKSSNIFSGNSILGGTGKQAYYYLSEERIKDENETNIFLVFFERFIDEIQGNKNILVKSVLRTKNREKISKYLNTTAFIFNSFNVVYNIPVE